MKLDLEVHRYSGTKVTEDVWRKEEFKGNVLEGLGFGEVEDVTVKHPELSLKADVAAAQEVLRKKGRVLAGRNT